MAETPPPHPTPLPPPVLEHGDWDEPPEPKWPVVLILALLVIVGFGTLLSML